MGQGVIRFQPVSRMNAVMVVTKTPKLLAQTTDWVRRLDRSDTSGTTLRTYRLKNGNATQVAKILNDIFGPVGHRHRFADQTDSRRASTAPNPDWTRLARDQAWRRRDDCVGQHGQEQCRDPDQRLL